MHSPGVTEADGTEPAAGVSLPAAVPAARRPASPASPASPISPVTGPGRAAPPRRGRRAAGTWLVVLVPALAELLISGYQLGRASLWRDEGYTREVAQRSTGQILALLRHQDAVHGLYYLAVHAVVDVLGASAADLRLPSLIAGVAAAGLTAALGRRLAQAAAQPAPRLTGLLAGLVLAGLPVTTWYAQDARPYAAATLLAVAATYLLVRGVTERRGRWWWAGYGTAVLLLALLNLVALLLVAAHGISLLALRRPRRPGGGAHARAVTWRWLAAAGAAAALLSPLLVYGARQNGQLNWVARPTLDLTGALITDFAGVKDLIPLALALTLAGVAADIGRRYRVVCPPVAITLPWLLLPPAALLAVSVADPVYVERYVVFCTPAAALLMAAGLIWLGRLTAMTPAARRWPPLAAIPVALVIAVMAAVLIAPQQRARTDAARKDDLRKVAAIVSRNEERGDAVLYQPWGTRVAGLAYPRPFARLADIGMAAAPVPSATLTGVPASPAELARRFAGTGLGLRRVWLVRWRRPAGPATPLIREQQALLAGLRLIRRWDVRSVELSLYALVPQPAG
ncbi:MAG TPA: glycosyltransferase family 39 protein [Streptosporangiaceae bacterium]|nr:glycosyltransferase family 39 protein [Streptosporangiaceae bacterium]